MRRLQFLLLELLSTNTCVNTYASARKTHGSKCTKTNLSNAFRANHGSPANISEPSFQHALVFWIKTAILWTKILCPFQRCLFQSANRWRLQSPLKTQITATPKTPSETTLWIPPGSTSCMRSSIVLQKHCTRLETPRDVAIARLSL